jgi:hypothetical protein
MAATQALLSENRSEWGAREMRNGGAKIEEGFFLQRARNGEGPHFADSVRDHGFF